MRRIEKLTPLFVEPIYATDAHIKETFIKYTKGIYCNASNYIILVKSSLEHFLNMLWLQSAYQPFNTYI